MEPPKGWIMPIIAGALFLATVFLIVQNAFLSRELSATKGELEGKSAQLEEANARIGDLAGKLNRTSVELELARGELENTSQELRLTRMDLNETSIELESTREKLREEQALLEEAMEEFARLRGEVAAIEESVNSSIQWFRGNSLLPQSMNRFFWKSYLGCAEGGTLKLACVPFLMERDLAFTYKPEYPDRLLSLDEMVAKPGGDCEDFSLFLKAYLNRLKQASAGKSVEAWDEGGSQRYIIYEDEDGTHWYVWGKAHPLGSLADLHPYAICFTTRYLEGSFEGHCMVALSRNEISSVEGIGGLEGADVFEPQNGIYAGRVGENYRICADGETLCGTAPGSIIFIIADDDLYQFMGGEWKSYKLYLGMAEELEEKIGGLLGE